jgi:hypothetical protein
MDGLIGLASRHCAEPRSSGRGCLLLPTGSHQSPSSKKSALPYQGCLELPHFHLADADFRA